MVVKAEDNFFLFFLFSFSFFFSLYISVVLVRVDSTRSEPRRRGVLAAEGAGENSEEEEEGLVSWLCLLLCKCCSFSSFDFDLFFKSSVTFCVNILFLFGRGILYAAGVCVGGRTRTVNVATGMSAGVCCECV